MFFSLPLLPLMRHAACVRGNDTDTRQLYQDAIRACLLVMLDLARVEFVRHVGRCLATRSKRRSTQRVCTALVLSPVSRPALPRETRGPGRACPPLGHTSTCMAVPGPPSQTMPGAHVPHASEAETVAISCRGPGRSSFLRQPRASEADIAAIGAGLSARYPSCPVAAAPLVGLRASVQRAPRAPHAPALHQVGRRAAPQVFVRRGARWDW